MADIRTKRMLQIAADMDALGWYQAATSVRALVLQRDELQEAATPFCQIEVRAAASVGQVTPEQVNRLREIMADGLSPFNRLREAHSEAEHLRMQIGYIVTQLMIRGDSRSLPEIVGEAAKATAPRDDTEESK